MKEDFLHYVWKYKLFNTSELLTQSDEQIEIINFGFHNTDAGPDFFNGKVKIGKTTWAGNIEIHINSSDWTKHNHYSDKAYDNVILHVVYNDDVVINDKNENAIPTLELKGLIDISLIDKYDVLINRSDSDWIPCGQQIKTVDDFIIQNWINRLAIERLERKSQEIQETLKLNKNNWEETFYQYLFKYFGLKVNALPFELLAKNTPLKIIEKHNDIFSIEALLYGQAGYLEEEIESEYYTQLKKEYHFLKSKFSLTPLDKSLWKLLRLRPSNFPTIRISQLANLLSNNTRLFTKIIEIKPVKGIQQLFVAQTSEYWRAHYQFGVEAKDKKIKKIGINTINNIIINVIVPFTFVYGKAKQNEELINKSLSLLENIKAENNSIVEKWGELGVKSSNAMQTQSLIELKNNYCSQKKCLNCSIGNQIIQQ
ncbi:MAG: hypothetical protein COA97_08780 [Flavobacteriales bacterium]|nr:MAG: hypothetical protein COA97_08780 [Flavobacteriales bacterium]